ncbi:hypothetical protein N473_08110 [Pseudoalteromonas luteoviolacea CPMOR-1]|uniref:Aminotransferase class V domain-containing protein n=1 Tax=Pseudoalteromonas luteoviolacea CPMOR-1 TaxID=1365248 RepID=A0A162CFQ0_9GAMM|nr:aminotransferase class V-fold PLP-dependent enzyme [Pseudoalteromonas luteoviolacea]KZN67176.1 hypothetical protein N473_08110 [Pseudoalteromonas luteoviolacea CPMOR-1]
MINADISGSAPVKPEVIELLNEYLKLNKFANPNSNHRLGCQLYNEMEQSRGELCALLGCDAENIAFNSGSTEGIRSIFFHLFEHGEINNSIIFYSALEHSATLENIKYYQDKGIEAVEIPHFKNGLLNIEDLRAKLENCHKSNILIAVMAAHNETGIIQDYQQIGALAHRFNAKYFSDTTQLIGKLPFCFESSNIDFAVASGHKFGALPGSGFLLIENPWHFRPLIIGGGQENSLRAGTQNYLGISSLAIALKAASEDMKKNEEIESVQHAFEHDLKTKFPSSTILGDSVKRVPGITFCALGGLKRSKIQNLFDQEGILITSGSACSDKKNAASRTALHLGYDKHIAQETIRISLGLGASESTYRQLTSLLDELTTHDLVA